MNSPAPPLSGVLWEDYIIKRVLIPRRLEETASTEPSAYQPNHTLHPYIPSCQYTSRLAAKPLAFAWLISMVLSRRELTQHPTFNVQLLSIQP